MNMPKITILTETDLRQVAWLDLDAVDRIESAFTVLASGRVVMPPVPWLRNICRDLALNAPALSALEPKVVCSLKRCAWCDRSNTP